MNHIDSGDEVGKAKLLIDLLHRTSRYGLVTTTVDDYELQLLKNTAPEKEKSRTILELTQLAKADVTNLTPDKLERILSKHRIVCVVTCDPNFVRIDDDRIIPLWKLVLRKVD